MLKILWRSADRLARVVDDGVQARQRGKEVRHEHLKAHEVSEVGAIDVQPIPKAFEIRLGREPVSSTAHIGG
jgi:hypothetical protein